MQACFGVSDFSPWSGQKGAIIKTEKATAREKVRRCRFVKDTELKSENVDAPHTLGGASLVTSVTSNNY